MFRRLGAPQVEKPMSHSTKHPSGERASNSTIHVHLPIHNETRVCVFRMEGARENDSTSSPLLLLPGACKRVVSASFYSSNISPFRSSPSLLFSRVSIYVCWSLDDAL